jgi:hypothetical protein
MLGCGGSWTNFQEVQGDTDVVVVIFYIDKYREILIVTSPVYSSQEPISASK